MEPKLIPSVYSHAVGSLLLTFVVALLLVSSVPNAMAYRTNATYIIYQPGQANWEWNTAECTKFTSENFDLAHRSRHRWAEFCGDLGPYTDHVCDLCLEVRNESTADDASVTVRIIDKCMRIDGDSLRLWMDKDAFDEIDTDGQGAASGGQGYGQIKVNYEITECGDEDDE